MQPQQPPQTPIQPLQNAQATQAPVTPVPSQVVSTDRNTKIIINAGRSAMAFGVLAAIFSVLSLLAASKASNPAVQYVVLVVDILSAVGLIVFARKCKSAINNLLAAKASIDKITMLCAAILVVAVVNSFVQHKGFLGISGLLALITMLYMIVARNRLKIS